MEKSCALMYCTAATAIDANARQLYQSDVLFYTVRVM